VLRPSTGPVEDRHAEILRGDDQAGRVTVRSVESLRMELRVDSRRLDREGSASPGPLTFRSAQLMNAESHETSASRDSQTEQETRLTISEPTP
jgi:hypothetical protein